MIRAIATVLTGGVLATVLSVATPSLAQAQYKGFSPSDWTLTVDFRRFRENPTCREKQGRGALTLRDGQNPRYVLSGFSEKLVLVCGFKNGNTFQIDVWSWFPKGRNNYTAMAHLEPSQVKSVHIDYLYQRQMMLVDGQITVHTARGKQKNMLEATPVILAIFPKRFEDSKKRWK